MMIDDLRNLLSYHCCDFATKVDGVQDCILAKLVMKNKNDYYILIDPKGLKPGDDAAEENVFLENNFLRGKIISVKVLGTLNDCDIFNPLDDLKIIQSHNYLFVKNLIFYTDKIEHVEFIALFDSDYMENGKYRKE